MFGKRELLQFFAVVSTNAQCSKWHMYVCKCKLKYINCEISVGKYATPKDARILNSLQVSPGLPCAWTFINAEINI
jgi:hypothetical protein